METWILDLIKGNGLAGGLVIAMFFYFKFNDFRHVNKDNGQQIVEHKEQHDLMIKQLEKQTEIKEILIEIRQHLKDRLNGSK